MRIVFAIALLTCVPASLLAQRFSPAHVSARSGFSHPHHRNFGGGYYPAYFDPLDWDYLSAPDYSVASQPPVIVMQAPAPPAAPEPQSPPSQPLVIELQGDRYVQVSGENPSGETLIAQRPPSAMQRSQSTLATQSGTPAQRDALLIFRDGHREQISGYTISGGFLYATADYYTAGTWNRKIELSSLNLPDTVNANHSRGIPFHLPSASNEVIVGP